MNNNHFAPKGLIKLPILFNLIISFPLFGWERIGDEKEKIVIIWIRGDKEVTINMVFMYTYNAKK